MSDSAPAAAVVSCPACAKRFRWKEELAGKKVRCACGAVLRMPLAPGGAVTRISGAAGAGAAGGGGGGARSAAPAEAAGQVLDATPACPSCGQTVSASAVLCVRCGYHLQTGQRVGTMVAMEDGSGAPGDVGPAAGRRVPSVIVPARPIRGVRHAHWLRYVAYALNAIVLLLGIPSLIALSPCGILAFFCAGAFNLYALHSNGLEGKARVMAVIANVCTVLVGLSIAGAGVGFMMGGLGRATRMVNLPAGWAMGAIGVVCLAVGVALMGAGITTYLALQFEDWQ